MKSMRIAVVICIFQILLSACSGSSPVNQPGIESTTWVLVALNKGQVLEGSQPTILFEDGQVSGNASCNSYGGSYQVKGDAISFGAMFMTEMWCMDEGVMDQENSYLELLGAAESYELVDGVLTIFCGH